MNRRRFLGMVGVGAVAAVTLGRAGRALAAPSASPVAPGSRDVFDGLVGRRCGEFSVAAVGAARLGGVAVVLASDDGARWQIDVLRRDALGPRPVATTRGLALFIANRGDGAVATPERLGLAVMALADALAAREGVATVPRLVSMREREAGIAVGAFSLARR